MVILSCLTYVSQYNFLFIGTSCILIGWAAWRFKSCQTKALHWNKGFRWASWWGSCRWVLEKSQGPEWFTDRGCLPSEWELVEIFFFSLIDISHYAVATRLLFDVLAFGLSVPLFKGLGIFLGWFYVLSISFSFF